MVVRRARREYRQPIASSPLEARDGFEQTVVGYSAEEAVAEASRCLDCHQICSLCVGVCPNMALMTYEVAPFRAALPELRLEGGQVVAGERHAYRLDQPLQIAVLTDFCNECGNCVTACPTSGRPYRDKPRLYLDRTEFEAESDNAFMLFADGSIEGRWSGATHRLSVDGGLDYRAPTFWARLDAQDFAVIEATAAEGVADGTLLSLTRAADLYALLRGLNGSMAHLPRVAASPGGTRVPHPGYAE
jgi:putative selenate reductase